jgi:hypothetical protein
MDGEYVRMWKEKVVAYLKVRIMYFKSRTVRCAGHVTCMGDMTNLCNMCIQRRKGKKPLSSSSPRWKDNIRMDLSRSEQVPVTGSCEHDNEHSDSINCA